MVRVWLLLSVFAAVLPIEPPKVRVVPSPCRVPPVQVRPPKIWKVDEAATLRAPLSTTSVAGLGTDRLPVIDNVPPLTRKMPLPMNGEVPGGTLYVPAKKSMSAPATVFIDPPPVCDPPPAMISD